jgi:F-type H+-transporting ATPase subunit epsilon
MSSDPSQPRPARPGELDLEIVTPEGRFLRGPAALVEIPTLTGEIGVLPGHVPVMTMLAAGELRIYQQGPHPDCYAVAGGFAEIGPEFVRILASFASAGEEEAMIDAACARAKEAMEATAEFSPDVIAAELANLRDELLRLRLRGKR